jgi:polyhydroxybutyrate depolymerase
MTFRCSRRITLLAATVSLPLLLSCGGSGTPATGADAGLGGSGGAVTGGSGGAIAGSGGSSAATGGTSTGGAATGGTSAGGSGGSGGSSSGGSSSGGSSSGGSGGTAVAGRSGTIGTGGEAAAGRSGSGGSAGAAAAGGRGGGVAGRGGGGSGGSASSCTGAPLTAGNTNKTIQVGGVSRSYILHVPAGYTGAKPVPLVLDFHGLGGTGTQEQSASGYQKISDQEGFLILFPNGIDNAWNIGPCCTNSRDVDDLGFAKAMVTATAAQACIDLNRVYATGISMGGGMSHYLACNAADVFAAVAPAAFDLLVPEEEPCSPSRPISVLAFRGTADTVVPYAGGKGSAGKITFLGAQASLQRWVGLDGCMTPTTVDGECTTYKTCSASVEVGLCVKQGGGHAGGDPAVGWAFLSRFLRP